MISRRAQCFLNLLCLRLSRTDIDRAAIASLCSTSFRASLQTKSGLLLDEASRR